MVKKQIVDQIKKDFATIFQEKKIVGIILYGSHLNDSETNRSDIDICIVAPDEEAGNLLSFIWTQKDLEKYDIRLFTELPLFIKIQVIEDGKLIYSPNKYDLYEYFYFFRKLWEDQKLRQDLSKEDLLTLFD
jgi:predicted nucleotidyltransferase